MKINNNVSPFIKEVFQAINMDKEIEPISTKINYRTAYDLDISSKGINILKASNEKELAIYNTDALTYTKDLRIINKNI